MSSDYSSRYDDDRYDPAPYEGDPRAERRALKEEKKGCSCGCACGTGCLILLLVLLLGGLILYYTCVKGVPMQVGPDTTVITEPLKSDGKSVDFFKAINDGLPEIPNEENGFRDVLAAYGREIMKAEFGPGPAPWLYEETCRALDLDPDVLPTAVYEDPEDYLGGIDEAGGPILLRFRMTTAPWTLEEQPKMKDWLDKVGPGLDIARAAAMKKYYDMPLVRQTEGDLCVLGISTDAISWHIHLIEALRMRGMLHLGQNAPENAWKDLLAAQRLYRHIVGGNDSALRNFHPGKNPAAPQLSDALLQTLANGEHWTPDLLEQAARDLKTLPGWLSHEDDIRTSRYLILDGIGAAHDLGSLTQAFAGEGIDPSLAEPETLRALAMIGFNGNVLAKKTNEHFDDFKKKIDGMTPEELLEEYEGDFNEILQKQVEARITAIHSDPFSALFTVSGRSVLLGDLAGVTGTTTLGLYFREALVEDIHTCILRAVIALERCKRDKGEYPETLDALGLTEEELGTTLGIALNYERTEGGYQISFESIRFEKGVPQPVVIPEPSEAEEE